MLYIPCIRRTITVHCNKGIMRTPQNDPNYLAKLQDFYARHRHVPAYRMLASIWGINSTSAVRKVLDRFLDHNFLERSVDGVWIPGPRFFERPMVRQAVQAGDPAADADSGMTTMLLDEILVGTPSRTVLLPVRGDSMIGANILEGDVVVVERQEVASPGEIVVAVVDGELTVKRLERDFQGWLLRPENPDYTDIRPEGTLELVGVVIGLVRRFQRPR